MGAKSQKAEPRCLHCRHVGARHTRAGLRCDWNHDRCSCPGFQDRAAPGRTLADEAATADNARLRREVQRIALRLLKDEEGVRNAGRYARTERAEGYAEACADAAKLLAAALRDTRQAIDSALRAAEREASKASEPKAPPTSQQPE